MPLGKIVKIKGVSPDIEFEREYKGNELNLRKVDSFIKSIYGAI